jgi:hypothetical protein
MLAGAAAVRGWPTVESKKQGLARFPRTLKRWSLPSAFQAKPLEQLRIFRMRKDYVFADDDIEGLNFMP